MPEYHFFETHRKNGAARKIDEYEPTMTPMFIANAKFCTRPVPKMFMMSVVANTVDDVRIERTSTSLIEMSMTRSIFLSFSFAWFSRMRSNTTTVSLTENPTTVRSPATEVSETSVHVSANTPMTMTASWIVAKAAPGAYRISNRNARYSMIRKIA